MNTKHRYTLTISLFFDAQSLNKDMRVEGVSLETCKIFMGKIHLLLDGILKDQ